MKKLVLVLALLSSSLWAAPAFVQSTHAASIFGATTIAKAFTSNVTTGNLLILAVQSDNSSTSLSGCADTQLNTFTVAQSQPWLSASRGAWVLYAKNVTGGADTVTCTFGISEQADMEIHEYSGLDTSSPLDVHTSAASADALGTAADSGSATTTAANDLIFGFVTDNAGGSTVTVGSGYTLREQYVGERGLPTTQDQIGVAAGSYKSDATLGIAAWWGSIMVSFKATGGAAAPSGFNKKQKLEKVDPSS